MYDSILGQGSIILTQDLVAFLSSACQGTAIVPRSNCVCLRLSN